MADTTRSAPERSAPVASESPQGTVPGSFIESALSTRVEYEASLRLPPSRRLALEREAATLTAKASMDAPRATSQTPKEARALEAKAEEAKNVDVADEADDLDDEEDVDEDDDDCDKDDVSLGFAVERSEQGALLRNQFPSKLGGRPAWLDPVQLPLESELRCGASGLPLRFLLQVYAPINNDPRSFHRTVSIFISPQGASLGERGAVRAFRCQLPRANDFYPYEPPEADELPPPLPAAAAKVALRRCAPFAEAGTALHDERSVAPFQEHELVVEPEPSASEGAAQDPQVDRLLADYQAKIKGTTGTSLASEPPDLSAFGAANPEVSDFAAFTARVSRARDQCLRYTYADDAQPLWASRNRRPVPGSIPLCERCGGRRRFEFQVMPQALNYLGIDSADEAAPDWSTIAVYTCAASCPPTPPLADAHGSLIDPLSAESAAARAAVGHSVLLDGLQARPELNGTAARVVNWHSKTGRWAVECPSSEKLRVRSANLRLQSPQFAQCADREGGYAEEYVWVQTEELNAHTNRPQP